MGDVSDASLIEEQRRLLEAHYRQQGTIPSMAGLARLWGYASKSSASRRVDRLIAAGVLVWSADRRLAPGPAFVPAAAGGANAAHAIAPEDPIEAALAAWSGYDAEVVRAYSVTARLLRVAHGVERGMAASATREGLTSGDVLLLDALYRAGPPHRITPTALKRYFLISLAGVSKRVDRLEALGFIVRIPNPIDRRGLYIGLTPDGRAALARLVQADAAAPHIVWPTALPAEEYAVLLAALTRAEQMLAITGSDENDRSQ